MGKKSKPSRKKLIRYFSTAAEIVGKAPEGAVPGEDCYDDGQAYYSLYWYFAHCIDADLNKKDPARYSPLLNAYLGADIPEILEPSKLDSRQIQDENEMLKDLFPQDKNPLNDNQNLAVHKALHMVFDWLAAIRDISLGTTLKFAFTRVDKL